MTIVRDDDSGLVRRAKEGAYEAFEELVGRHASRLYGLAAGITRNREDAEDVVQKTFLSAIEHLKDFREEASFKTWITRIATNHALEGLRRKKGKTGVPLAEEVADEEGAVQRPVVIADWRENPADLAERAETRRFLDEALAEVDEKYRTVFLLRDVEGFTTAETAQILGIGVPNVKVRLLRARLQLREKLTEAFGDEKKRLKPGHGHDV